LCIIFVKTFPFLSLCYSFSCNYPAQRTTFPFSHFVTHLTVLMYPTLHSFFPPPYRNVEIFVTPIATVVFIYKPIRKDVNSSPKQMSVNKFDLSLTTTTVSSQNTMLLSSSSFITRSVLNDLFRSTVCKHKRMKRQFDDVFHNLLGFCPFAIVFKLYQKTGAARFIKYDIQGVFLKCAEILPTRL
jgi:hypothetical protein